MESRLSARSRRHKGLLRSQSQLRYVIDKHGRQHFNFRQRLWLDPAVPMAHTRVLSTALLTLAVNLLDQALHEGDALTRITGSTRGALTLARQFSEELLLDAPDEGWVMPRAAIRAWLGLRLRGTGTRREYTGYRR